MTTLTRTISSGPAECKAEPPVALNSSSLLGMTTVVLPLQLALGADCCTSGGPSAQCGGRSFNFPHPTVRSTSVAPRVASPHQCAGMRLKPHQKHCCSRRSISSQNRHECGSERGCARSLRNCLHGHGPVHSPLNTCSRHFKCPLIVLRLRTRHISVLSPGIVAFFEVLLDGSAPRWCASVQQLSNGMRLLHHPRQHPLGLRDAPLPDQDEGLITHHLFDSLCGSTTVARRDSAASGVKVKVVVCSHETRSFAVRCPSRRADPPHLAPQANSPRSTLATLQHPGFPASRICVSATAPNAVRARVSVR